MKKYSEEIPVILEERGRKEIAKQIFGVLKNVIPDTTNLNCLDVGASSGVISAYLSDYFKKVVGVDVDEKAINLAKKKFNKNNLKFLEMNGEKLEFEDESFDIVVCHQVYNFVDNPQRLMNEIYRVLKRGGICYFSGRNKYALIEPQYKIPFLSWMPISLASSIIKISGKGSDFFGKNYMSYSGLQKLLYRFKIVDYTLKVLRDPNKYGFRRLVKFKSISRILPEGIVILIPNYIFVLKK